MRPRATPWAALRAGILTLLLLCPYEISPVTYICFIRLSIFVEGQFRFVVYEFFCFLHTVLIKLVFDNVHSVFNLKI